MESVALISGSLRKDSYNTKLIRAFADELPNTASADWIDCNLPLFNEDLESEPLPEEVVAMKETLEDADAVIISTPEYNRGMSGVLKNTIDWASRPPGKNSFKDKPVLVAAASPGSISGALAYYQVVQTLTHLGVRLVVGQEFLVGNVGDKFSSEGELIDEKTKGYIRDALARLQGTT